MPITPKFPLSFSDLELYKSTGEIKEVTKFHIKNIVLTNPGEKISDPDFGVGVKGYLFENFSNNITQALSSRLRRQISRYAPHVEILSVIVDPFEDENSLDFKLSYYIPVINESDILSFSITNSTSIY
tara:strand:+ start:897 stop:1280 length:384 start_codon:yes stop_codon:yes gene_type:complete